VAAGMIASLQGFERRLSSGEDQPTYLDQIGLCLRCGRLAARKDVIGIWERFLKSTAN